jgi:predicted nucleotidyltransferase
MLEIRDLVFSPKASMHHYLSMAKGNFREYLQSEEVRIKKYFYVLRPILACLWIEKYDTNPPILFQSLLNELVVDPGLRSEIDHLLECKMSGEELDLEKRIDVINDYVESEIARLTEYANSFDANPNDRTEMLDELFRKYLNTVW